MTMHLKCKLSTGAQDASLRPTQLPPHEGGLGLGPRLVLQKLETIPSFCFVPLQKQSHNHFCLLESSNILKLLSLESLHTLKCEKSD